MAKAVMKKNSWIKSGANTLKKMSEAIDAKIAVDKIIKDNKGMIGPKLVLSHRDSFIKLCGQHILQYQVSELEAQ